MTTCTESWAPGCDAWGAPHPFHGCHLPHGHRGNCECRCGDNTWTKPGSSGYRVRHTGRPGDRQRAQAVCGTLAGYYRHRDRGEPRCDACKAAKAAYQRSRKAN